MGAGADTPITPWPAGPGAALLVGGTFDPPHAAHVRVADEARRAVMGEGAWLVFVPAARSPHKRESPGAGDEHRVEMVRLACRGLERAAVWTDEIDRARGADAPSYSVDTLARAREAAGARGSGALRFLIGADQAVAFHKWREFREILELAEPVVAPRGGVPTPEELALRLRSAGVWTHEEVERWRGWTAPTPIIDASATETRAALADPARRGRPIEHLDEAVRAYILREGLYL